MLFNRNRRTTHPGEVLLEEVMKPRGLDAVGLAELIGIPDRITELQAILNAKVSLRPNLAAKIVSRLNTSVDFWLNLQQMHDETAHLPRAANCTMGEESCAG